MPKSRPSPSEPCLVSRARVARCGTAAPAAWPAVSAPLVPPVPEHDPAGDCVIAVGHPTDKALRLFFSRYPKKKVLRRRRRPVRGTR